MNEQLYTDHLYVVANDTPEVHVHKLRTLQKLMNNAELSLNKLTFAIFQLMQFMHVLLPSWPLKRTTPICNNTRKPCYRREDHEMVLQISIRIGVQANFFLGGLSHLGPKNFFDSARKTAMLTCNLPLPDSPHPKLFSKNPGFGALFLLDAVDGMNSYAHVDTYRSLQRHRAVFAAIARLSNQIIA